ncbi:DUF6985 domain-containing protein [Roseibacillus persicicus]|uniref:DUF6985 domain-containing protein n=1 Tax=Roseibacillus persicicus TaxID=454148 RepID=A0A918WRG5_9BACT|nr:hypothetical protein [Roseibacillus persicicus]GHC67814.1 hypothetical protein GCM10007100_39930 [Roseibacillus persicicus]
MKSPVIDSVFGELKFEDGWVGKRSIEFPWNAKEVEVWVQGNDENETILSEQRDAYSHFIANEKSIVGEFSEGMFRHYQGIWPDLQMQFGESASELAPKIESVVELSKVIRVVALVFPIVVERGERKFGFLGECSWDTEHGFGFRMGYSIGGSDLLT